MSSCSCPAASLTSVSFDHGMELRRCGAHDTQQWVVDGQVRDRTEVLTTLREAFLARRAQRRPATRLPTPDAPPPALPAALPAAPAAAAPPVRIELPDDATAEQALTALLRARGVDGAWAIA